MSPKDSSVICFGEVLFDVFPSGSKPGGAPMNVAVHLQNLGINSSMISRVGNDDLGKELMTFLKSRGVNTDLIQVDQSSETGIVRVNIDKNESPTYTIVEKVAWDYIDDSFLNLEINPKYIVHGSLICRSTESHRSLRKFIAESKAKIVFDLNVRSPYYNKSIIDGLLKTANIVKMNEEEFSMIKDWFYIKNPKERGDMRALNILYPNIEIIIVTKGGRGASAWRNGEVQTVQGIPIKVKDTVGSGDAFLAAFLFKIDSGGNLSESLRFASATGAYVASQEGANPHYSEEDILNLISK